MKCQCGCGCDATVFPGRPDAVCDTCFLISLDIVDDDRPPVVVAESPRTVQWESFDGTGSLL